MPELSWGIASYPLDGRSPRAGRQRRHACLREETIPLAELPRSVSSNAGSLRSEAADARRCPRVPTGQAMLTLSRTARSRACSRRRTRRPTTRRRPASRRGRRRSGAGAASSRSARTFSRPSCTAARRYSSRPRRRARLTRSAAHRWRRRNPVTMTRRAWSAISPGGPSTVEDLKSELGLAAATLRKVREGLDATARSLRRRRGRGRKGGHRIRACSHLGSVCRKPWKTTRTPPSKSSWSSECALPCHARG